MVLLFLGERQRFANESAYALSKGAVKAFDMLGALAVAVVTVTKDDALISPQQVGVAFGV